MKSRDREKQADRGTDRQTELAYTLNFKHVLYRADNLVEYVR